MIETSAPTTKAGYSVQARLSLQVSDRINNGRIDLYFASQLNPARNPPSSNPLEIFAKLDRVSRGGRRPEDWDKAETIRAALANWAHEAYEKGLLPEAQLPVTLHDIKMGSSVRSFEPVLVRLTGVLLVENNPEWDECVVRGEEWRSQRLLERSEIGAHL